MNRWIIPILTAILTLAACTSTGQTVNMPTPSSPASMIAPADIRTPFSTKQPILTPPEAIMNATHEPLQLAPTPRSSPSEQIDLPVLLPSVRIGKGSPTSLAVSLDGRWMAIGTQFGVYQYHADTFEQAWFLPLPDPVESLAFDPQSKRLGANAGGAIVILDVATGDLLTRLQEAGSSFAWSPDGQRLVSGGGCERVTVWDASRGADLNKLRGGKCSEGYSGIHVTWAADGRIYAASMGAKILAWNGDTFTPIEDFSAEGAPDTWVSALLAAPSGGLFAQYDALGGSPVAIIDGGQSRRLHLLNRRVNGSISGLAWAPDGQRLAVNYRVEAGLTLIWNAITGQVEQEIEGFYAAAELGWSPDERTLFGLHSLNGQIQAVEVSTGRPLRGLDGHASAGSFLTWTQDGLASSDGATLTWWDPDNGQALHQETIGSLQTWVISWPPSGPGTYLYSGTQESHQVGSFASRQPLEGDEGQYPFPSAWSWDGSRLADPTRIWDALSGEIVARLRDPAQRHTPDVVAWSPDGERLASADSLDMQPPVIWDAQTGEVLLSLNSDTNNLHPLWLRLAWSPDGDRLAAVGSLRYPNGGEFDEGMILVWNTSTGQQEQLLTVGMQDYRLWTVAWSPDGHYLACGTTGSELFLWDMVQGIPLARLQGHTDVSDQIAWSLDSSRLASVARDGTLQIWNLSSVPSQE